MMNTHQEDEDHKKPDQEEHTNSDQSGEQQRQQHRNRHAAGGRAATNNTRNITKVPSTKIRNYKPSTSEYIHGSISSLYGKYFLQDLK